jgi:hypothetical protein
VLSKTGNASKKTSSLFSENPVQIMISLFSPHSNCCQNQYSCMPRIMCVPSKNNSTLSRSSCGLVTTGGCILRRTILAQCRWNAEIRSFVVKQSSTARIYYAGIPAALFLERPCQCCDMQTVARGSVASHTEPHMHCSSYFLT